jgi:hypothetical protein
MAAAAPLLMVVGGGIQAKMQMDAAQAQAKGERMNGEYANAIGEINADIANTNAQDAEMRGEKEANAYRAAVKKIVGKQRARLAAQGLDTTSGSAGDLVGETGLMGELDALTIRNNARREAYGFRVQARQATMEGRLAQLAGDNNAKSTILTGNLNALNTWMESAYSAYKAS